MANGNKILSDYLNGYHSLSFDQSKDLSMTVPTSLTTEDIVLMHVKRITFEDEAPRKEAIENVLSALRLQGVNFLYVIKGFKDHVEFYYGIVSNLVVKSSSQFGNVRGVTESILKKSIEGNFRGSDIEMLSEDKTRCFIHELQHKKHISCICGVPGINKEEAVNFQGVDRLVDTMLGEEFLFIVSAFSLGQNVIESLKRKICDFYDQLSPFSKFSEQKGTSEGTSTSVSKSLGNNVTTSSSDSNSETHSSSKTHSATNTKTSKDSDSQVADTHGSSTNDQTSSSHTEQHSSTQSEGKSKSDGTNHGNSTSFSVEHSRKNVQDWMAYADETLLRRLDYGQGKGLFMTNISLFADDELTLKKLENTATALFSGEAGNKTPLKAYHIADEKYLANVRNLQIPKVRFEREMSDNEEVFRTALSQYVVNKPTEKMSVGYWGTWMSVNELGIIAGLPRKEVVGLSLNEEVDFGLNYDSTQIKERDKLSIGKMIQSGIVKDIPIYLDKNVLNKHIFVCGVTGCGKTTTCMTLLRKSRMPFLVIEPAKTEYRILTNENPTVLVFTLGEEKAPFRLNPLEFLPSESISSHVDMLKASIEAAFDMEAAIPQIIEAALYKCYEEKGWDVITNHNKYFKDPFADGVYSFPMLSDLIACTEKVVKEQGFDERLKNDYIGSIRARLQGLTIGTKGLMLNAPRSVDFRKLVGKKVILELENVKSGTEKSLIMGFVLSSLNEAIKYQFREDKNFKHITLVEEAHRLLSRYMPGDSPCKKNGVDTFADMLAEMRKYGECLIIADQIPSKMAPDVLKNTNTKIVHKIFAQDDKDTIGNTMSLTEEQKSYLSNLNTGRAVVFTQGWDKSIQVKIEKGNDTTEEFAEEGKIREICLDYYVRNYARGVFPEIQCFHQIPSVSQFEQILRGYSYYQELQGCFKAMLEKKKACQIRAFHEAWGNLPLKVKNEEVATYLLNTCFPLPKPSYLPLVIQLLCDIEDGVTDFSESEKQDAYESIFNNL